MKNISNRVLIVISGVILTGKPASVMAATEYVGGKTYTYQLINNNSEAEIYKASSTAAISPAPVGSLSLPATLGGVPVTSIGHSALYQFTSLTSVTIPATVKSIGQSAFSGCTALTNVIFSSPASLTNIGTSAFANCTKLSGIALPDTVATIQNNAFSACTNLSSFVIPPAISVISSTMLQDTKLSSIIIPTNIVAIEFNAFASCAGLTNVTFTAPSSVKTLGQWAFQYCRQLSEITLPNSITNIDYAAFQECGGLTTVVLPNAIKTLPDDLFISCTNLTTVTIPESVTSIGSSFRACINLKSIHIPASVKTIGANGFRGCFALTSVVFSASSGLTTIGSYGFDNCSAMTSIKLPESVTTIGESAFRYCSSMTSIEIPASVTYLWKEAFRYCSALTSVTFYGNAPASLGTYIYLNTPALTTYVPVGSTGWGVTIPGTWQTKAIRYFVAVSFDAQGGATTPSGRNAGIGLAYGTLPDVTRNNYVFGGWFTQPNGGGTEITSATTVTATTPHTLYAKWTAEPPTVVIGGETVTQPVSTNFMANVTQAEVDATMAKLIERYPEITAAEVGALTSVADAMGVNMALLSVDTNIVLFAPKVIIEDTQMTETGSSGAVSLDFTVDNGITGTTEAMQLLAQSVSRRIQVIMMDSLTTDAGMPLTPTIEFTEGRCKVSFTLESPWPCAFFRIKIDNRNE